VRNWVLTGNPLYSHSLPGGFQVNPIHAAIMSTYKSIFSISHFDLTQWLNLFITFCIGAPFALLAGTSHYFVKWRDTAPLALTTALVVSLWIWSIGQTSGGAVYSMRMLTPAIVALSMSAGAATSLFMESTGKNRPFCRFAALIIGGLCAIYSMISVWSHPFPPQDLLSAITYAHDGTPEICEGTKKLTEKLQTSNLQATGVLTSNAYLAIILQKDTRFRPVMVWSPEVRFVFDQQLTVQEIQRRLIAANIRVVSFQGDSVNNSFLLKFPFFTMFSQMNNFDTLQLIAAVNNESLSYLLDVK
jgi:hypothetical protein